LWGKYELGILNREHDHPDNKQNDHYLTYLNWLNENARDNKYQIYYNIANLTNHSTNYWDGHIWKAIYRENCFG